MKNTILLVDDNALYRGAFRRNLELLGFQVIEAENKDEAIDKASRAEIHAVITDLDMRFRTEGLELIRHIRQMNPFLPVVLISAVGTFEEGAIAQKMGAVRVISKSSLDKELESLYEMLQEQIVRLKKNRMVMDRIKKLEKGSLSEQEREFLRVSLRNQEYPEEIKTLAFEILDENRPQIHSVSGTGLYGIPTAIPQETLKSIEREIMRRIPDFKHLEQQTQEAFRTAEFLWQNQESLGEGIDFSRSIGFAYTFAVENECKIKFKKNFESLLKNRNTYRIAHLLLDEKLGSLNLWFQRYLLFLQDQYAFQISLDNIVLVIRKVISMKNSFKPDGLKALGICLMCFAREYDLPVENGKVHIENVLNIGLNSLADDSFILGFARDLIQLQHHRNPFIHPEIPGEKKISAIRDISLECLNKVLKL